MEVIGKVKVINPEQQVSATFRKRELVVMTDEQYPQYISINFVQDKCDLLSAYQPGDEVKVSINLRGREWVNPQGEVKYFNDIQGWRIERMGSSMPTPPTSAAQNMPIGGAGGFEPAAPFEDAQADDLPF